MVFAIDSVVSVGNAETKPCLDIGDYTGTAGENSRYNGQPFSTFDQDNNDCGTGYAVASKEHGVTQHT